MKFSQAFKSANKDGMGIYRQGWGLRALCYVVVDDFILENYSDDTKRTLTLTYRDIVATDWEVCDRGIAKLIRLQK